MTNSNANNTNDITFNDEMNDLFLEACDSLGHEAYDGTLASSFREAARQRAGWRAWLIAMRETKVAADEDVDWFDEQIEATQSSSDEEESRIPFGCDSPMALNRWGARYSMDDALIEYGIVVEERALAVEGDTHNDGYIHLLEAAEQGPDLCHVKEHRFEDKAEAVKFIGRIRKSFKAGDHQYEILSTRVDKTGEENIYIVLVLEADGNWSHKRALSNHRDNVVTRAIHAAEKATTKGQLMNLANIAKRYSRDMQVLNNGGTFDKGQPKAVWTSSDIRTGEKRFTVSHSGRKIGCGLNFVRFATVMNAIADRANELGFSGFKTYEVKEFESHRKPVNGDMLEVGAREGEFVTLDTVENPMAYFASEEDPMTLPCCESLWSQTEGRWEPSDEGLARLKAAGPTGFVYKSHEVLEAEHSAWLERSRMAA